MIGSPARRALAAAAAVLTLTAAQLSGSPAGLGDRLYPTLGNPGYRVSAYDISLDYHANNRPLDAVTRIDGHATADLAGFTLDFAHGVVRSVTVNGLPARFGFRAEKLLIAPAHPIARGSALRIVVTHTSDPNGEDATEGGWIRTPDGLAMADQADAAHRVFPCNDHPSDKAWFTFRIITPRGVIAVANGLPSSAPRSDGQDTVWTYRTAHPMATELAQVSIGRSAVVRGTGPDGLPLRDVVGAGDRARLAARLAMIPGQIAWMERQVGPYPFETYGILSVNTSTGFELETQTLSLFERRLLLAPTALAAPYMLHELSHQWFGDSVTPATWSDLWLNEGHATWYEWRYRGEMKYGPSLDAQARAAYAADNAARTDDGPPARPASPSPGKLGIFRNNVYGSGALVLYALRQEIGDRVFRRLERAWVTRYRDGNASTADFIALASQTAGRDLSGFLRPWLYGATTPPMPGRPDWRPGPLAVPSARIARQPDRPLKPA
ncbi:M1 family metallopeptidase [Streptomyces sp. RB6PN25]|uniref:Aminopeptidase N n=1 Tax=Streptomyces humicola TaxID=2953240 RepID=A0ABT1PZ75_9ACTN|nr:M1 family metallopeptidase [Streptomyces humicola]MCQ4082962.1 M1 family metallopeptidase [Streptomyces humicola]